MKTVTCYGLSQCIFEALAAAYPDVKFVKGDDHRPEPDSCALFDVSQGKLRPYFYLCCTDPQIHCAVIHSPKLTTADVTFMDLADVKLTNTDSCPIWATALDALIEKDEFQSEQSNAALFDCFLNIDRPEPISRNRKVLGVLVGSAMDMKTKEIADGLGIVESTVRGYKREVRKKHLISSDVEFARYLVEIGFKVDDNNYALQSASS